MVTMLISERMVEISERIEYLVELMQLGEGKLEYMEEISDLSTEGYELAQMNPEDTVTIP
tara:strand:+ start:1535 stop:1714 length:180 start_codon:yes stop_codon:yes gene_type:complete